MTPPSSEQSRKRVDHGAAQQRDAADEGRLDAYGSVFVGTVIMNQGEVVRPSQLIASVRRTSKQSGLEARG
jgi:hypothetical protein